MCAKSSSKSEVSIEDRLESLYDLQQIDSEIDKINFIKGELPMEVQDIEDEIQGLQTRKDNILQDLQEVNEIIIEKNRIKEESKINIEKLEKQQNSVKNNREFESISKEIELAKLEIELSDKKIKDNNEIKNQLTQKIEEADKLLQEKDVELKNKKDELQVIERETDEELQKLQNKSDKAKENVDDRLLKAYTKIRTAYRNGMAIVSIDRDSCGGCFAKIPLQRQLEIRQRKKIIVCENCGRIFCYPKDLETKEIQSLEEVPEEKPRRSRSKRTK